MNKISLAIAFVLGATLSFSVSAKEFETVKKFSTYLEKEAEPGYKQLTTKDCTDIIMHVNGQMFELMKKSGNAAKEDFKTISLALSALKLAADNQHVKKMNCLKLYCRSLKMPRD